MVIIKLIVRSPLSVQLHIINFTRSSLLVWLVVEFQIYSSFETDRFCSIACELWIQLDYRLWCILSGVSHSILIRRSSFSFSIFIFLSFSESVLSFYLLQKAFFSYFVQIRPLAWEENNRIHFVHKLSLSMCLFATFLLMKSEKKSDPEKNAYLATVELHLLCINTILLKEIFKLRLYYIILAKMSRLTKSTTHCSR